MVVEQVIRPTGLVDPVVEVRPAGARWTTCWRRSARGAERRERVLVTMLTKSLAEELAEYYQELGIKADTCTARSTPWSGWRSCATCAGATSTC